MSSRSTAQNAGPMLITYKTGSAISATAARITHRRRQHDPLGEGQPCTWRSRLIKVAAEITTRSRRVLVRLSSSWPHRDELFRIGELVTAPDTG